MKKNDISELLVNHIDNYFEVHLKFHPSKILILTKHDTLSESQFVLNEVGLAYLVCYIAKQ